MPEETQKTADVAPVDYAPPRAKKPSPLGLVAMLLLLCGGIATIVYATRLLQEPLPAPPPITTTPRITVEPPAPPAQTESVENVFQREIVPLIEVYDRKNQQAAERATRTLHEHFQSFRRGVPSFADDITGWGTRFGVAKRMSSDLWQKWWHDNPNASRVQGYVAAKFEHHILSEQKLNLAVQDAIRQFQDDLAANRNELLAQVKLVLEREDLPVRLSFDDASFANFADDVMTRATQLALSMGQRSLASFVLTEVGSAVVGAVCARIAISGGTYLATTLGLAGGATVGGTVAGGGAGTVITPGVGTIIGAGVGLAVGAIYDWWRTEKFKEKISGECSRFLAELEQFIIDGPRSSSHFAAQDWNGMRHVFSEANRLADASMREAMLQALMEKHDER